jgi:5-methylcytosine-specific restriction endonuclease McrA
MRNYVAGQYGRYSEEVKNKLREKARNRMRINISLDREGYNSKVMEWRKNNKDKIRAYRKAAAEKKGKEYCKVIYPIALVERNAIDAFNWWFSKKSEEEVARWYEATGKPWLNPRLSEKEKRDVRRLADENFSAREKSRNRIKKIKRKKGIIVVDDMTLSSDITKTAKSCVYCGKMFNEEDKPTIDHIVPLNKGGIHSISNVIVSCRSCNSKKSDMDFYDWVSRLDSYGKRRAAMIWKRLKKCNINQQVMF